VDPLRLRQILNNLVGNAIKFTSEGSIEIRAELLARTEGKDHVCISVHDTGVGISPENQALLFQPFSQGDVDTTRQFGGTGLGLAICRRLAEMMGGAVEMRSQLGAGTTVLLTVPLPIAEAQALPKAGGASDPEPHDPDTLWRAAPSIAQAEQEGTLALLVDDHPINRMLLLRQVNTLGYAAETANDGLHALGLWKSGRFGIVVTDCNMPKMDGYELARNIRRLEGANGARHVPIIACTANAMRGEPEKCFNAGMDDYLIKPIELKQLSNKLEQWLPLPALETADASKFAHSAGATSAPPSTLPPDLVDLALVAETFGGDPEGMASILAGLRTTHQQDAEVLRQAVLAKDLERVTYASHRMLGAGRMIGAREFSAVCQRLEDGSRAGDWDAISGAMPAFDAQWLRLKDYLDAV
jgi:CheY-like chemotaxis protein/HPt (histidine-containing phosphotransfer) domain-containing protein